MWAASFEIPVWMSVVLAIAGVITALYVIFQKGIRPMSKAITEADEMLPVMRDLTEAMRNVQDIPAVFEVVKQIVAQFRTDSGSSLRDVIDRLEAAAEANQRALGAMARTDAERNLLIASTQEAQRILAQEDRVQIARLLAALDKVDFKQDAAATLTAGVAVDLEASHQRAEAIQNTPGVTQAGEAADAAAQRPADTGPVAFPPPP